MAHAPRLTYEFGPYRLEVGEYRLLRDGQEVRLRRKVMDFLLVLLRDSRKLWTKEELLDEVWPNTEVEESNLAVCVKELREALGPQYIETVPGRGYRFAAPATVIRSTFPNEEPLVSPVQEEGPPVGALPPNSRFYIKRATDDLFCSAIDRRDSVVLVNGTTQVGKSSLLARGLERARQSGATVVLTDLQSLNAEALTSIDKLFQCLAEKISNQLDFEFPPRTWRDTVNPNMNFENYLRREILPNTNSLVWGLDEVDRLFEFPYSDDIFGLFRAFHNARSLEPAAQWTRLTLALAYATEAHLFIKDLNQSPFNIGTRLGLEDFTLDQVADLNRRYGSPLKNEEISGYYEMVKGHPYLVHCGIYKMARGGLDFATLRQEGDRDDGPFGDHLRHMCALLERDAGLCQAVRALLRGEPGLTPSDFYRLRSAGVLSGDSRQQASVRCPLYSAYFKKRLL
jgi:DNA-binding winged helix-turn-helix (wHTH) protein